MPKRRREKRAKSRRVGNIHDQAFKRFFSDESKISGLLRRLVPKNIFDLFDLKTLKIVDSRIFSKHNLRERHGDIIVDVRLKGVNQPSHRKRVQSAIINEIKHL